MSDTSLHPARVLGITPEIERTDPLAAVDHFATSIVVKLQSDYGDWMRDANRAWHELVPRLHPMKDSVAWAISELHDSIQYNPTWHPVETCRRAFRLANFIRRELGATTDLDPRDYGLGLTEPEPPLTEFESESPFEHHRLPEHFEKEGIVAR